MAAREEHVWSPELDCLASCDSQAFDVLLLLEAVEEISKGREHHSFAFGPLLAPLSLQCARTLSRLLRTIFSLFVCLLFVGGHYGVLQGIAWTGMLIDYSAQDGLLKGAADVFDGEHPCGFCLVIEDGKKKERESRQNQSRQSKDLDLKTTPLSLVTCLSTPGGVDFDPASSMGMQLLSSGPAVEPPTPPPRSVA